MTRLVYLDFPFSLKLKLCWEQYLYFDWCWFFWRCRNSLWSRFFSVIVWDVRLSVTLSFIVFPWLKENSIFVYSNNHSYIIYCFIYVYTELYAFQKMIRIYQYFRSFNETENFLCRKKNLSLESKFIKIIKNVLECLRIFLIQIMILQSLFINIQGFIFFIY